MNIKKIFRESLHVEIPKRTLCLLAVVMLVSTFYESDMNNFYNKNRKKGAPGYIHFVEDYGRFTNTAIQALLPFVLRDPVGVMQAINVGILTTASTHTLKFALNDVRIGNTRLGQRPRNPGSSKNMPSGHSSMASCALGFVGRRYGSKWLYILLPVLILTMYARFMLDAHTISATIAGACLGIISALLCTSRYKREKIIV
ncbi:MAG: lipid A 1-phosphatase LpxE [Deltaproteobacteria bacterium]|nr:MAG: lipid A 1-phosphatase LpxE [Deltaproteobacteria bacterium]